MFLTSASVSSTLKKVHKAAKAEADDVSFVQAPGRDTLRGGLGTAELKRKGFKSRASLAREGAYTITEEETGAASLGTGARFPHSRGSLESSIPVGSQRRKAHRAMMKEQKESLAAAPAASSSNSSETDKDGSTGPGQEEIIDDEHHSDEFHRGTVVGEERRSLTARRSTRKSTDIRKSLLSVSEHEDQRTVTERSVSEPLGSVTRRSTSALSKSMHAKSGDNNVAPDQPKELPLTGRSGSIGLKSMTSSTGVKGVTASSSLGLKGRQLHNELEKDAKLKYQMQKNESDDDDDDDQDDEDDNDKDDEDGNAERRVSFNPAAAPGEEGTKRSSTMSDLLAFVQAARNLRASVGGKKSQSMKDQAQKKQSMKEDRRKAAEPVTSKGLDGLLGAKALGVKKYLLNQSGLTLGEQRRVECIGITQQYKKTLEFSQSNPGPAAEASSRIYLGHLALVPPNEDSKQMKASQSVTERRRAVEQQLHRFFRTYVANPPSQIVCDFDEISTEPHCPRHVIVEFHSVEEAREALSVCRRLGRADGESHPQERVAWGYCGYAWGAEDFKTSQAGQGKSKKVPISPSKAARRYNVPAYEEGPPLELVYERKEGLANEEQPVVAPAAESSTGRRRFTFSACPPHFKESYYGARMGEGRP